MTLLNAHPVYLIQLKPSFPDIKQLQVSHGHYAALPVPYPQIFAFCSNLKTLAVALGWRNHEELQLPNCDAQFCGVYQEEVELLWGRDQHALRNVNIAPIRPCANNRNVTQEVERVSTFVSSSAKKLKFRDTSSGNLELYGAFFFIFPFLDTQCGSH